MIINSTNKENKNVKFISYNGKYPCLCSGVLTLEIEGKEYKFGHDYNYSWKTDGNFDSFWSSGGSNNYSNSYVNKDEWIINEEQLPEQFKKYVKEIDEVFNENIPYGCCGGCL